MQESVRLMHVVNAGSVLRSFLGGQLRYMTERGMQVAFCAPPGVAADEYRSRETVESFGYPIHRTIAPGKDLRAIAQLSCCFRTFRPDIVHAHGPKAGMVAMIAARLVRTPVRVYHVRGLPFLSDTQPQRLLRATTRLTCALATQVLTISQSMTRELIAAGCCPETKVKSLCGGSGNGVDADERFNPNKLPTGMWQRVRAELAIPTDGFVVGFVGRIVRDKGITELLAAWDELRCVHPKLHLMLVGPLEPQDPIPAQARQRIVDDPRIHWLGETWDTPRLYAAMDLLVLPSYREGLGMVLLEAGAMRLPVIATNIPGCIDAVLDGTTGMLVPPCDSKALADAISAYIRDVDMCQQHGQNGRARVLCDFRQEALWEATYAEYVRLLERCGISAGRREPRRFHAA